MKRLKRRPHNAMTYTVLDVMFASPDRPIPEAKPRHQLLRMYGGLAAIEQGEAPTSDDWRMCSDAVNLLETLILQGTAADVDGLLMDAITALAIAGKRHIAGGQIRLDGPGIAALRAVLADYKALLEVLSERVIVQCHRDTERRIRQILAGRLKAHDVEIVQLSDTDKTRADASPVCASSYQ